MFSFIHHTHGLFQNETIKSGKLKQVNVRSLEEVREICAGSGPVSEVSK